MPAPRLLTLAALSIVLAAMPARAADLKLEIADGRVTLIAHDVPARQILNEWARIGQIKVVNADKLPSTLLTLQIEGMPEKQALEIVLRNASGYLAAPRTDALAGLSAFDRIVIMPPSTAVAGGTPTAPRPPQSMAPQPPTFRPGAFPVGGGGDAVDDQDAPVPQPNFAQQPQMPINPGMPGYIAPPPVAPAGAIPPYPGAPLNLPNGQQPQQATPQNPWGVPAGGAVPGMISPVPQPGVPNQPGVINPFAPPKKPGGSPQL